VLWASQYRHQYSALKIFAIYSTPRYVLCSSTPAQPYSFPVGTGDLEMALACALYPDSVLFHRDKNDTVAGYNPFGPAQ
jgi:hypothetical protein